MLTPSTTHLQHFKKNKTKKLSFISVFPMDNREKFIFEQLLLLLFSICGLSLRCAGQFNFPVHV